MTSPATPQAFASAGPAATTTEEFLRFFPGHWVQYFDDGLGKDRSKALGTPQFDAEEARRRQEQGCGVFFSPNAFDGMRRSENLLRIQAVYVDIDVRAEGSAPPGAEFEKRLAAGLAALRGFSLPPQVIIRTKNGLQAIWRIEPLPPAKEGRALFHQAQERLVERFGADPAAKDVTRVLRLPGFLHLKDPASPFPCHLLDAELSRKPYPLSALLDALKVGLPAAAGPSEKSSPAPSQAEKRWRTALEGVAAGERNVSAASVCGKLLADLSEELWDVLGWGGVKEWNARNTPPLPEPELRAVYESVAGRERRRRLKSEHRDEAAKSQTDLLVQLVLQSRAVLFCDQFGTPHAHVPCGSVDTACKIRSQEFREWLAQHFWKAKGRACGGDAVSAAVNTLAGMASFQHSRIPLHCRVCWHDGAIWYDLADAALRAVRVSADGWEVVTRPPILFRRFNHQLPQRAPVRGRPLDALLKFVNLKDRHRCPLLLVYLVSCFVPDIPHPIAYVHGPQGAGKSTLVRLLRRLVDPTSVEGLSLPARDQLAQALFHHWFAAFDNVSAFGKDVSDALCRAVTGEGITQRRLYSDDEDHIYQFRRCVCLNGIGLEALRPDLLDRCLLFPVERVPEGRWGEDAALFGEFERLRPELLGAVFDALSLAMRLRPKIRAGQLPRMADFARWGAAIAEALGIGAATFAELYNENIREQHEEAIAECPAAFAVLEYMAKRDEFCGTASELLKTLAKGPGDSGRQAAGGLPRSASILIRQLHLMRVNLAQFGLQIETRRTKRVRKIEIRKVKIPDDGTKCRAAVKEAGDGKPLELPSPTLGPGQALGAAGDGGDGIVSSVSPPADASG